LEAVRAQLKLDSSAKFITVEGFPIEANDEAEILLSDIIKDKKVFLVLSELSKKEITFYKNGKPFLIKSIDPSLCLV
jgi:hypothetical protein